jgi:hypothetical protein
MKLVGHKSEATYRRYAIVPLADARRALTESASREGGQCGDDRDEFGRATQEARARKAASEKAKEWRRGSESNRRMKDLQTDPDPGLSDPPEKN